MDFSIALKNTGRNFQNCLEKEMDNPNHRHSFWSMELCDFGEAVIFINGERMSVRKGDILIIGPEVDHHFFYPENCTFGSYSFKFDLKMDMQSSICIANDDIGRGLRMALIGGVKLCFNEVFPANLIEKCRQFAVDSSFPDVTVLEELLSCIMQHYLKQEDKNEMSLHGTWLLKKIKAYVFNKGGASVSVEEIAKYLNYSSGHLRLLTRTELKCSPKDIIDAERIRIMKNLLKYSDMRISELAEQMKFPDEKYCSQFFRKHTGISPRNYRRSLDME